MHDTQRRSSRQTERSPRPAWLAAEFGSGRRWHAFGGAIESTAELHCAPTITDVMKEHHRGLRVARCRGYPGSCPISGTTDGVEGERLNNRMPVPELCSWMQDFRCRGRTMRCGCTRTSSGRGRGCSALCGTARGRRAGLIHTGAVLRAAVRATAYQCDGNHAPRRYCDEPRHADVLFGSARCVDRIGAKHHRARAATPSAGGATADSRRPPQRQGRQGRA
jgi:hypothetical protein